jgi:LuxR family transcriptional regulator, regulator of acetate metabolism
MGGDKSILTRDHRRMVPTTSLDLADVLVRLCALGPPSELRARGPALVAEALVFDRVLLTRVSRGQLVAEAIHSPADRTANALLARLRASPIALDYPSIEGEMMRRRRGQVVAAPLGTGAFSEILGWEEYVATPVLLDGIVTGFLHADRVASEPALGDDDVVALSAFAVCFGVVYERAVLRHRIRTQRQEIRQFANWAEVRAGEWDDNSITLGEAPGELGRTAAGIVESRSDGALRELMTRRELEVLQLMVRGETNGAIARDLVVSEGTVKFHVKNILRKLHATNRADATSRYLRMTLHRGERT